MNLATRCTACGTMFRVVQDQLKVSDGWVRCGRCQAVFNAQESLFDLEHDTPPPWQAPPETTDAGPVSEPADKELPATASFAPDSADEVAISEALDAEPEYWAPIDAPMPVSRAEPDEPHADANDGADTDAEQVLEFSAPSDALATEPAVVASDETDAAPTDSETVAETALDDTAPEVTPGFLQQAQRSERWQQPPMRRMLWALVAVSGLLLGAQVIHHFRQVIAAQHTGALPWLQGFCAVTRCQIDTLQRIADVSIESTALTQAQGPAPTPDVAASAADTDAHILRLAIILRNRGEWAVAMPSVDLSLTGSDGELVARRSLSPLDFGVGDPRLPPGLDTPLSLRFRVGGGRVSGYTVEVFYP
jgi:predicted Zn finger-like uncharacterized protein